MEPTSSLGILSLFVQIYKIYLSILSLILNRAFAAKEYKESTEKSASFRMEVNCFFSVMFVITICLQILIKSEILEKCLA